jgi:hypothetical protein
MMDRAFGCKNNGHMGAMHIPQAFGDMLKGDKELGVTYSISSVFHLALMQDFADLEVSLPN